MIHRRLFRVLPLVALAVLVAYVRPMSAQTGKIRIRVRPHQAFVFVDTRAIGDGAFSGFNELYVVKVSPGEHTVGIYNYGYKSQTHKVTVEAGRTVPLDVVLEALPGSVSGPFGRIQIEGGDHAAVLLNGKTPDFLVGQADEFNHDIGWKQELLVPPGTHQMTLVRGDDVVWSGPVTVEANKRVIVDIRQSGATRTTEWPRGQKLSSVPPFRAGTASATVAINPVSAQFSAAPGQIGCGESAKLNWSSTGAVKNEINNGVGEVAASGEKTVQPTQTTTYTLNAAGPGGVATPSTTVNVASAVQASLDVSPAEIRYRRRGDTVLEQGTAKVNWAVTGANTATLEPFGSVSPTDSRTVQAAPRKTDPGPVDETITYRLTASNGCGGSDTKTATLHITGNIEPASTVTESTLEIKLAMNSVYFPTALPRAADPEGGLVQSQQNSLAELAGNFKKYLEFRPQAHLIIQAHADKRGSAESNQALSERRSNRVKSFLIEQGVPAANIETTAFGSSQNLSEAEVKQLVDQNPNITEQDRKKLMKNWRAIVLANNRRVDITLSTTKQTSARYFPFNASDFQVLLKEQAAAVKAPAKKK
ncbi:MAG: OmpA family protein [Terriglobia bacterium]